MAPRAPLFGTDYGREQWRSLARFLGGSSYTNLDHQGLYYNFLILVGALFIIFPLHIRQFINCWGGQDHHRSSLSSASGREDVLRQWKEASKRLDSGVYWET